MYSKFLILNSQFSILSSTFAPALKQFEHWRDGRVVDYSGLENRRAERHRGFESLSLRKRAIRKGCSFLRMRTGFSRSFSRPAL